MQFAKKSDSAFCLRRTQVFVVFVILKFFGTFITSELPKTREVMGNPRVDRASGLHLDVMCTEVVKFRA